MRHWWWSMLERNDFDCDCACACGIDCVLVTILDQINKQKQPEGRNGRFLFCFMEVVGFAFALQLAFVSFFFLLPPCNKYYYQNSRDGVICNFQKIRIWRLLPNVTSDGDPCTTAWYQSIAIIDREKSPHHIIGTTLHFLRIPCRLYLLTVTY